MVPYRGRLALRIARIALAAACLVWYARVAGERFPSLLAVLAAYLAYAIGVLYELRRNSPVRARIALVADTAFFGFWSWIAGSAWAGGPALAFPVSTTAGWMSTLLAAYLLASAVVLHDLIRVTAVTVAVVVMAVTFAPRGETPPAWAVAVGALAIPVAFHKRYLDRRLSNALRRNVIARSQALGAREAERQRIAADFHDGPLQSFIGFQMRLEVVKKLLARNVDAAADELRQLQELCRSQVGELRRFVRSMRPPDDGASLPASLSRMLDQFQRETGINATFSGGNLPDPAETEVSLELLQIVRETLNNIQKHSGATRLAVSIGMNDRRIEIRAEDNGSGFPFSGTFSLDELELLRLGPVSIKRRVRMLGGDLQLDSRPGQGASLQIRIPV